MKKICIKTGKVIGYVDYSRADMTEYNSANSVYRLVKIRSVTERSLACVSAALAIVVVVLAVAQFGVREFKSSEARRESVVTGSSSDTFLWDDYSWSVLGFDMGVFRSEQVGKFEPVLIQRVAKNETTDSASHEQEEFVFPNPGDGQPASEWAQHDREWVIGNHTGQDFYVLNRGRLFRVQLGRHLRTWVSKKDMVELLRPDVPSPDSE